MESNEKETQISLWPPCTSMDDFICTQANKKPSKVVYDPQDPYQGTWGGYTSSVLQRCAAITPTPLRIVLLLLFKNIFIKSTYARAHTHLHTCKMPTLLRSPLALIAPGIRSQWPPRKPPYSTPCRQCRGKERGSPVLPPCSGTKEG